MAGVGYGYAGALQRQRLNCIPFSAVSVEKTGAGKWLEFHYLGSRKTFRALRNNEFNRVTFVERFEAFSLNCGVVHEDIVPGSTADKSITLFVIKPLYGSLFFHLFLFKC